MVRRAGDFARAGARLVLVDPGPFRYSGGVSAVLGGSLPEAGNLLDLPGLSSRYGVEHVRLLATGLDPARRSLWLGDGTSLPFDLVSFDIGSRVATTDAPGDAVYAAKPIAELSRLRADFLKDRRPAPHILVIGGGATGVEIAGNLARLARTTGRKAAIVLVAGAEGLLTAAPRRAGRIATTSLRRSGVRVVLDARLVSCEKGEALLTSGERLSFDRIVHATGLSAEPLMARLGLPLGPDGGLLVSPTLASPADPRVFAAGDCASIDGHPRAKAGVHGVRAAPVLAGNLLAALVGGALRAFHPQAAWLSILDLGDGTGLAIRAPVVAHGRAVLAWKRRIDRRFLERYR